MEINRKGEEPMIDVNQKTYEKQFYADLAKKEKELKHKLIPFCTKCVILEYEDRKESIVKDLERRGRGVRGTEKELDMKIDFEKFSGSNYFDLKSIDEAWDTQIVGVSKVRRQVGVWFNYKCKKYNHGASVLVPLETYETMKKENKLPKIVEE